MAVASHFFAEPALGFRKRSRLPTRAYQVSLTWPGVLNEPYLKPEFGPRLGPTLRGSCFSGP